MSNIRTLRNKISGVTIALDLSNVAHLLQHSAALETGLWMDDAELSEALPQSEDELRAEIATLKTRYDDLEREQDGIQAQIRALAKRLPEDERSKMIVCPF